MTDTSRCSACGTPLPAGSESDRCPRCAAEADATDLLSTAPRFGTASRVERVGPYRVLRSLGEGGMGAVYLAEQERPVRRTVALKLILPWMDSEEVMARFEAERQALALMDHPAIAKVFDAGVTGDGRPYFAMEYIPGETLLAYCDENRLGLRERCELFLRVCEGVQHAHQKGVIHRDLKPQNILVREIEGRPQPSVIDFGIAKATEDPLTDHSIHTMMGQVVGTPVYMSPEQAASTGRDVDTRTDVYALGVILYELLTGRLPFPFREEPSTTLEEVLRRIREDDPIRASTRVSRLGGDAKEEAGHRGLTPEALVRRLRGDLDWIVLKAIEKDRERRYGSPGDLAADLRRFLGNEPVLATPPSATYLLGKFVRRHRVGVAAGSAILVALVLGILGTTVGMLRAREAEAVAEDEARAAEEVSDFLVGIFESSNPYEEGDTLRVIHVLDRGLQRIEMDLEKEPLLRARLQLALGDAYRGLGQHDRALELSEAALRTREELLGEGSLDVAVAKAGVGQSILWGGRYDAADAERARTYFEEARAAAERELAPDDPKWIPLNQALGILEGDLGNEAAAEAYLREAYEMSLAAGDPAVLSNVASWLGMNLSGQGKSEEAEEVLRRGLEETRGTPGADYIQMNHSLGRVLRDQERYEEALPFYTRALDRKRELLPPDHVDLGYELNAISITYQGMGEADSAIAFAERSLAVRRNYGPGSPMAVGMMLRVSGLHLLAGNRERAADLLDEAWPVVETDPDILRTALVRLSGGDPEAMFGLVDGFVELLRQVGRPEAAEALREQADALRSGQT